MIILLRILLAAFSYIYNVFVKPILFCCVIALDFGLRKVRLNSRRGELGVELMGVIWFLLLEK